MPTLANRKAGSDFLRARMMPDTINETDRTVEVTFGTDTPVPMWIDGERAMESLSFAPGAVRLDFFNRGAQVLDNHNRYGSVTNNIVGVIDSASLEQGRGKCKIRFATNDIGEKCFNMVKEKTLNWVSVGYRVYKYTKEQNTETVPLYTAIDWEPFEVSFTPVPADQNAGVRQASPENDSEYSVTINNEEKMPKGILIPGSVETEQVQQPAVPTPDGGERAANPTVTAPGVTPAAPAVMAASASQILQAVRAAGLDIAFAETLAAENLTADAVRERCIQEWSRTNQPANINGANPGAARVAGPDPVDTMRSQVETAFMHRIDPSVPLVDGARQWSGLSVLELQREILRARSVDVKGMTRREIMETAMGIRSGGMHTTADFPIILGNTINRTLRNAYELQGRSWLPFSQKSTANDFREMTRAQLGEASGFDKVLEGGEYKRGTTQEQSEKYKVEKFGKIYGFSYEMMVNDDLSAFTRMPRMIAGQAVQSQNKIVWGLLATGSGQIMADTKALFHADHGNLAGTGTALSVTSLAAARAAMRKQKALDGSPIDILPKFLIVSPDLELLAYQFTSTNYVPAKSSDVNVAFITNLTVIVDPYLTGNAWYLAAAPGAIDTLEYAFLEGEQELFTETKYGFNVDGMEIKARMVFGAHVIDYRSFYKNPGA